MGKVDYAPDRGRVYETAEVENINVALDNLVTQSTNIDSTNIREEGLDRSVVIPEYWVLGRQAFTNWPAQGEQIPLSLGVWTNLELPVGTPFESGNLMFNGGDALVVRFAINLESGVGFPFGLPEEPTTNQAIRFSIRLRIDNVTDGTSVAIALSERAIGGPFEALTVAVEYEIPGHHGSLSTMTVVPSPYNVMLNLGAGDVLNVAVEYRTDDHTLAAVGPVVGQAVLYVMRYPKAQDSIV